MRSLVCPIKGFQDPTHAGDTLIGSYIRSETEPLPLLPPPPPSGNVITSRQPNRSRLFFTAVDRNLCWKDMRYRENYH